MSYISALKKQSHEKNTRGVARFNLIVIFGFLIVLIVFLIESNSLVGRSYELRHYQESLTAQNALAKKVEVKKTEQESLGYIQEMVKRLDLVVSDKVKYLSANEVSVALLKNLNP